ncbi:Fungal Zn2-Cys6 binuclear cluster domain-containing protein [Cladophialophora immunda]|nr:Fungal Zn2-Cys6 binuclear cluster domain-containing protein [Cladophialophora immunda]
MINTSSVACLSQTTCPEFWKHSPIPDGEVDAFKSIISTTDQISPCRALLSSPWNTIVGVGLEMTMHKEDRIVIVGAGIFGLSTAHKLAQEGYQNILVLDRHLPPTPDASSSDISRVVRFDYADEDYLSLAYEAYQRWQLPRYKGIFFPAPYILVGSGTPSHDSWISRTTAALSRKGLPWAKLDNAADAKNCYPILSGPLASPGFFGYQNIQAGWADANKAVMQLRDDCLELGISFVSGRAGTVVGFNTDGRSYIQSVRTLANTTVEGDHFVLATGAWSSGLVPMYNSTLSTAQVLGYVRLTDSEMEKYKTLPIYANFSTGWFNFPPHKDTKMLKMAVHGWGYTRTPSESERAVMCDTKSSPPLVPPRQRHNFAPPDGEQRLRQGLRETLPELADRPFERVAMCWYTDTPTGDFVMDFHPDYKNLFVGGGGSGHAFKFLPVLGEYMSLALKKRLPPALATKWRFRTEYEGRKDTFLGDGSRGGPERRELYSHERAKLRKKIKCTAERPTCSFCRRLNQECLYLPREQPRADANSGRVTKAAPQERFRRLEAQVSDIFDILQSLKNSRGDSSHDAEHRGDGVSQPHRSTSNVTACPPEAAASFSFESTRPEPPPQVLDYLVDIYRKKIHLQPLPLLNPEDLRTIIDNSPQYLRWSFLALTVSFSNHDFYKGKSSEAIKLYSRSAADTVMKLAAGGNSRVDILQSLCLLAFKDIKAHKLTRAWMTIGTTSRLASLRQSAPDPGSDEGDQQDAALKCFWSIFILEKTFPACISRLPSISVATLNYPLSAPLPTPHPTTRNESQPPYFSSEETIKDFGINAYWLDKISLWGDVAVYLHEVRAGKVETPWSSQSTYARLIMKMHECEAKLPQQHLLRNVSLSRRSHSEIAEQDGYWRPWAAMEIISHAAPAILNHPFLHIVAMRSNQGVPQSRLFLQQTVDQALFHAGWVFRLIHICEDLEQHDPLIGHLVAATATIPLFFQFAKDQKVAQKAKQDLAKGDEYLSRMSGEWPHIAQKLEILRNMQSIAKRAPETTDGSTIVTFPPLMLWELLDPQLLLVTQDASTSPQLTSQAGGLGDASIGITTHFTHPLVEEKDQGEWPESAENLPMSFNAFSPRFQEFEHMPIDDFFPHVTPDELDWFRAA